MIVRRERTLVNNQYQHVIKTNDWSSSDVGLINEFSEPVVECGGHFDNGSGLEFDLQTRPVRVKSGFPITQIFDGTTDATAKAKSIYWGTTVENRIAAAVTTLRMHIDDYSGTDEHTY